MSDLDSHSLLLSTAHNAEEGAWARLSPYLCVQRSKLGADSLLASDTLKQHPVSKAGVGWGTQTETKLLLPWSRQGASMDPGRPGGRRDLFLLAVC